MTQKQSLFNYTLSGAFTTQIGKYVVTGFCIGGSVYSPWSYTFEVSSTGYDISEAKSVLYASLFFVFIFLMVSLVFVINQLPSSNTKDEEGKILSISYLKYLRPALWFVEWMLFIAILYLSSNIAFAYLQEQLFAKTLFVLFRVAFSVTPVIVIVWMMWMFVKMFHDRQLQKIINRGIFPQGKL